MRLPAEQQISDMSGWDDQQSFWLSVGRGGQWGFWDFHGAGKPTCREPWGLRILLGTQWYPVKIAKRVPAKDEPQISGCLLNVSRGSPGNRGIEGMDRQTQNKPDQDRKAKASGSEWRLVASRLEVCRLGSRLKTGRQGWRLEASRLG